VAISAHASQSAVRKRRFGGARPGAAVSGKLRAVIEGIRAVLLDLDGVLYVEDEPIPGAVATVAALREAGLALRFVTNTTSRPRAQILERLRRLGFAAEPHEVITPAELAVRHCLAADRRHVLLLMTDAVKSDFAELDEVEDGAEAVIVGDLGEAFAYHVLNRAFRMLMSGAELVALQKNRYWLTPDGLSLDVGAFVAALEYAAGTEAVVVGKPSRAFFASILDGIPEVAAHAAMVGDDVESDIGGAQRAGLAGILVRTGKFRDDALRASGVTPAALIASIADLPGLL
jgi:HAD superfamily hydrolase (TIGR01458 family)